MEITLCDRFPAYTPTSLRRERAHEVFLLINRYSKYSKKENDSKTSTDAGVIVKRKPAGDNWF